MMDFEDILAQWDEQCRRNARGARKNDDNVPRKRLANASDRNKTAAVGSASVSASDGTRGDKTRGGGITQSGGNSCGNGSPCGSGGDRYAGEQPRVNPMDLWLRRYGVVDKDAAAAASLERERAQNREYLKSLPPEAKVDLHGLTRDEAWARLDSFIGDCAHRGLRKVLIVHGKGNHSSDKAGDSVLSAMVRSFIECDKRLGISGHPDKKLGGTGATWVIIRKK
ncbi:Smr/MutS family protein [Treponema brennaborense]|uniref:Smr protein/MutS2 n=1 Tax=Treponema brennaborense (strain DSM 12168 / CIP 105900 / DD5/3) TaxID=906968 RepID=F4LK45_TREBD|nr:Smr/MutS family protein [Treponema brennaborense]AEE17507.1 Smr protein/MutS2 [Treponema brennaborense DSM 12168]